MFKRFALWLGRMVAKAAVEAAKEKVQEQLAKAAALDMQAAKMAAEAAALREVAKKVEGAAPLELLVKDEEPGA